MPARAIPWIKALVHLLCLLPLLYLLQTYRSGGLASVDDPVSWTTHFTGHWALWLLLASLAITPLRRLHRSLQWLVRLRRLIGLYAFFYATLHVGTYVFLFSGYDTQAALGGLHAGRPAEFGRQLVAVWPTIRDDLQKQRFIQAGLLAWILLLILALTSPQRALRWMGGRNWQRLHRLVYLAAFLAVVHTWWQMKQGQSPPWKETSLLFALLTARVVLALKKRVSTPRRALVRT